MVEAGRNADVFVFFVFLWGDGVRVKGGCSKILSSFTIRIFEMMANTQEKNFETISLVQR